VSQDDPLVAELRRFIWSYVEHEPECGAVDLVGPAVFDPANCSCGLTARAEELLAKVAERLDRAHDAGQGAGGRAP
jgi:hypothetical protein